MAAEANHLSARPSDAATGAPGRGLHSWSASDSEDGLLYIPAGYSPSTPAPLAILCHGAGSEARAGIAPLLPLADGAGVVLLAPDAHDRTWDLLVGDGTRDAPCIDALLAKVFDAVAVDASRVALGGFSDGASYALSLGLANGDLFTHLIAFSPGFADAQRTEGSPRVFMSHGVDDPVLDIDRCSRRIAPWLRDADVDLEYVEFDGDHTVPAGVAKRAMEWFVGAEVPRPLVHEEPGEPERPQVPA